MSRRNWSVVLALALCLVLSASGSAKADATPGDTAQACGNAGTPCVIIAWYYFFDSCDGSTCRAGAPVSVFGKGHVLGQSLIALPGVASVSSEVECLSGCTPTSSLDGVFAQCYWVGIYQLGSTPECAAGDAGHMEWDAGFACGTWRIQLLGRVVTTLAPGFVPLDTTYVNVTHVVAACQTGAVAILN